jgi:pimeloyl-ACP methyl ester carboxylesterase
MAWVAVGFLAAPALAADDWRGTEALRGGKGYVATPLGQVHVRDVGPRDGVVIVLLHQTPMSMIQFAEIQNEFAALGIRSIALDTPGYGTSDHPEFDPTIPQFADNVLAVLDALRIPAAAVAGHHTGATIALSLAARHPARVQALVVHGVPYFTRDDAARFAALPLYDRAPKQDGDHLARFFRSITANGPDERNLANASWMVVTLFQQGRDTGHPAVYAHDTIADVARARAPALILSDEGDGLHPFDRKVASARPDWHFQVFTTGPVAPLGMMNEPARWANTVAAFLNEGRGATGTEPPQRETPR